LLRVTNFEEAHMKHPEAELYETYAEVLIATAEGK
jgi:hypothetical protein